MDGITPDPDPQAHAAAVQTLWEMAGKAAGKWWWVWKKVQNRRYFLGRVQGSQKEAVRLAKHYWPKFVGKMVVECYVSHQKAEPLPNELCELCGIYFPVEFEGQTVCRCCDLSLGSPVP